MLFVAVCKAKEFPTAVQRITSRAQWSYSDDVNVVAEYWLQSNDPTIPTVISVFEADDAATLIGGLAAWDKDFEMIIVPAVTAEEGLNFAQQLMQQRQQV